MSRRPIIFLRILFFLTDFFFELNMNWALVYSNIPINNTNELVSFHLRCILLYLFFIVLAF